MIKFTFKVQYIHSENNEIKRENLIRNIPKYLIHYCTRLNDVYVKSGEREQIKLHNIVYNLQKIDIDMYFKEMVDFLVLHEINGNKVDVEKFPKPFKRDLKTNKVIVPKLKDFLPHAIWTFFLEGGYFDVDLKNSGIHTHESNRVNFTKVADAMGCNILVKVLSFIINVVEKLPTKSAKEIKQIMGVADDFFNEELNDIQQQNGWLESTTEKKKRRFVRFSTIEQKKIDETEQRMKRIMAIGSKSTEKHKIGEKF